MEKERPKVYFGSQGTQGLCFLNWEHFTDQETLTSQCVCESTYKLGIPYPISLLINYSYCVKI